MPIQIYENERVLRLVDPDDPLGKSSRDSGSNREVTSSGFHRSLTLLFNLSYLWSTDGMDRLDGYQRQEAYTVANYQAALPAEGKVERKAVLRSYSYRGIPDHGSGIRDRHAIAEWAIHSHGNERVPDLLCICSGAEMMYWAAVGQPLS
ncbi:hypothetical protein An08g09130 [Aspergillus niger]|uniref:Uncharacterized protein n=2 Tax=Aspergillus niger TaxID=5061 RepID=A5AB58_ASPNC|nr:hypothetical protein An08g09130 [Aspergillus niger]CAK96692.1 hypothetical protein An08g09130 [Aspergillus niger]